MINAIGLTKNYGPVRAVDNVSFEIREGEITGLLGPNGAGKTTTLRMLTCYLRPDGGSISVGSYTNGENPIEIKKLMGYLPESAPLYGDMLVYDYLSYVAEIRGIEDRKKIEEMGELCGILEVMHKNISELSKGYKQRVGLAQSMIHDPDILVLDEPTSGLDPNQIIEIRNLIKKIGKKKTIILSTHILSEVEATCDRIIIISRGKIVADDRTENLQLSGESEKTLSLLVQGADFPSLSGEVRGLAGVTGVTERPGRDLLGASVTYRGGDIRPEIFRLAVRKNWVLYEMKQEQKSLENIFRELTLGGNNDQA